MTPHTSSRDLAWLKQRLGQASAELRVQGDEPLLLDDPSCAYVTLSEHHQLFCVGYDRGRAVGRREHLATVAPGQFVFGVEPIADTSLVLSGVSGSAVWRFPTAVLFSLMQDTESRARVAAFLDAWFRLLLETLAGSGKPAPSTHTGAASTASAPRPLVWVAAQRPLAGFGGLDLGPEPPPVDAWPLPLDDLVTGPAVATTAPSTAEHLTRVGSAEFAAPFCRFVVSVLARRRESLSQARLLRDRASKAAEGELVHGALAALARVGSGRRLEPTVRGDVPLTQVCHLIARHLGVAPPALGRPASDNLAEYEKVLARASGLRNRRVVLDRDWHLHQSGPLLGYLEGLEAPRPVALLPTRRGYALHDPVAGTQKPVDRGLAASLLPQAHQFYRPLPTDASSFRAVLRAALHGAGRDVAFVVALGMAAGSLAMLVPWLTAIVFGRIIPGAERGLLHELGAVLVAVTVSLGLFDLTRGFVLVRLQTRMDTTLEAAVWDRLLSLPLTFFRRFSAGDLAARAAGLGRIRDVLVGNTATALLGALFSSWNLALLLFIDPTLACAGLAWIALLAATVVFSAVRALERERTVAAIDGKIAGLLLQLFSGIGKLRAAGAENRAFSVWAGLFGERRDADLAAESVKIRAGVLPTLMPTLASATLFWLLVKGGAPALTTGEFLAFSAAFGALLGAVQRALEAALGSLSVVPMVERAQPILRQPVEALRHVDDRIELCGAIELSHVSFRYTPDGPLVLDDVDFRIESGEFVAIVGPSGSGKSTLLRLMLGLEACSAGGVFYDQQPLPSLDIRRVRQQIGVVLQSSRVSPGDVYSNIVGNTGLGLDEAWRAARLAELAKDIEAMPMGMSTIVSQGGGTLSGGQRQRLLIARALATSPRILLFDEATSALDNVTQAAVSASLAKLQVTRVVVAHRLSTVRHADKIIVLERGRVVETGRFAQLMAQRGAFWQLAQRQTL